MISSDQIAASGASSTFPSPTCEEMLDSRPNDLTAIFRLAPGIFYLHLGRPAPAIFRPAPQQSNFEKSSCYNEHQSTALTMRNSLLAIANPSDYLHVIMLVCIQGWLVVVWKIFLGSHYFEGCTGSDRSLPCAFYI